MSEPKKIKKLYEELLKKTLMGPSFEKDLDNDIRLQKAIDFLEQHGLTIEKFDPKNFSLWDHKLIDKKKAYPNYDQYTYIPGQHDIKKWLLSVKDIYYRQKAGLSYKEAVKQATQGWKKMEVYDFLNWLRFHEEGSHMKYKYAQTWYENGQPGYFLHIKQDAPKEQEPVSDTNAINEAREESERNAEKRDIIEKQRQKIIGRLDSAEKLLRSPEGQQFAGQELENLMEAIYGLKKKVQLVNKLSVSTRLYEDMIVREANILGRKGFTKAANMLYLVAQTPGQSAQDAKGTDNVGAVPTPTSPPDPSGAGAPGFPGGLPVEPPATPDANTPVGGDQNKDQPPANALLGNPNLADHEQEQAQPEGIRQFIENMNDGNETNSDDNLEVKDQEEELMVTEAQAIPQAALEDVPITDTPAPMRGKPAKLPVDPIKTNEEPLEVTENDIPPEPSVPKGDVEKPKESDFDAKMEAMLANVTIADIVSELEDLSKVFKVREIPRRLSIVDMMLDSKGLASYFPSLSEAQNKALESNNYISTRVEDILSKLRGSIETKEIDLHGGSAESSPEVAGIRGKLEQDEAKDKQRKQMRKEQAESELVSPNKETPQVEMEELSPKPEAPPVRGPVAPRPLG